jgi:hypothetical protein
MQGSSLWNLTKLTQGIRSRRISSYDTAGGNGDRRPIPSGQTLVVADLPGAGAIRHLWMTTKETEFNLRALVLRIYWDGEETPSVECPLGDFYGLGHARPNNFNSVPLQASHMAMNCWFAMPFAAGARITVTNEHPTEHSFLYYYIDYHEYDHPSEVAGTARFHANWKRELVVKKEIDEAVDSRGNKFTVNTTGKDNYVVLDVEGKGHYVGCVIHLDTDETGWWGEGDDMFFIDGETWPPHLHGTGMEDYFCGAWNYNQLKETDCKPYYGYHFKGNIDYTGKHSQYRFHIEDPVYFEQKLLFSIEHGHANDKQGDWSSTAYWYQVGRTKPLPGVGSFEDRIPYAFGGLESGKGKDRNDLPSKMR